MESNSNDVHSYSNDLQTNELLVSFPPLYVSWERIVQYFGNCDDGTLNSTMLERVPSSRNAEQLKCTAALFDCLVNSAKGLLHLF